MSSALGHRPLSPQFPSIPEAHWHIHTPSTTRPHSAPITEGSTAPNSSSPPPQLPGPWLQRPPLGFHLPTCPSPSCKSLWAAGGTCADSFPTLPTSPMVILRGGGRGLRDSFWDTAGLGSLPVATGRSLGLGKGGGKEEAARCPDSNSISGPEPSFRFKFESQFCPFWAV